MPPVLIDTNVLVYLYDLSNPLKAAQARQVMDRLELTLNGRLSVQSLAEFFHVSTRKLAPPLSKEEALQQISLLMRTLPVFDLTPMIVLEAARGSREHELSYYDAQIWAAARLNQVPLVFSEDFSDGQVLEGVRFVNPFASDYRLEDWVE